MFFISLLSTELQSYTVDLFILKLTLMMPRFCVKTPCLKTCSAAEE